MFYETLISPYLVACIPYKTEQFLIYMSVYLVLIFRPLFLEEARLGLTIGTVKYDPRFT